MGMKIDSGYHVSDPFFVVDCAGCGAKYWSTRRVNRECAKCGMKNPVTHLPEHILAEMRKKRKEDSADEGSG